MAKKPSALDIIKSNASKKESKSAPPIPVLGCTGNSSSRILKYLDLSKQEKEITAAKELIGQEIRTEARKLYANTVSVSKVDIPSSIRMVAEDGEGGILFCVQDKYANVTEDKKTAIIEAGYEDYLEDKVSVDLANSPAALQKKVAELLVKHLSVEEQKQLFKIQTVVKSGSLNEAIKVSTEASEVLNALDLLNPTQQLRQG